MGEETIVRSDPTTATPGQRAILASVGINGEAVLSYEDDSGGGGGGGTWTTIDLSPFGLSAEQPALVETGWDGTDGLAMVVSAQGFFLVQYTDSVISNVTFLGLNGDATTLQSFDGSFTSIPFKFTGSEVILPGNMTLFFSEGSPNGTVQPLSVGDLCSDSSTPALWLNTDGSNTGWASFLTGDLAGLTLVQQNGDSIPGYPTGTPNTASLFYLGPDNFATGGQYMVGFIVDDAEGNLLGFVPLATSADGSTWGTGAPLESTLNLFLEVRNVPLADVRSFLANGSATASSVLTSPPVVIGEGTPVFQSNLGVSLAGAGPSPFNIDVVLYVTNMDGTQTMKVSVTQAVAASASLTLVDWTAATVTDQVGADLTWDGTGPSVSTEAGGVFVVTLSVDVS